MKKTFYLLAIGYWLLATVFISGCQESAKKEKAVETTVNADSNFPTFLVGTWEVNSPGMNIWKFTFDVDGNVVSLRNFMNTDIVVSEGGAFEKGTDPNEVYAITVLGPIDVNYISKERILTVKVVTDSFIVHVHNGMLEGNSVDIIKGSISADGNIWDANWLSLVQMEGVDEVDPNDVELFKLTFRKVP
ncbi:MAG: hypothetical protein ACYC54_12285 [Sedimentisphaerales bacterium]